MSHITVPELARWQRGQLAFTLLDVRRAEKRAVDGDEIAGGQWRDPARWLDWEDEAPPRSRPSCTAPSATRSARA